MEHSAEGGWEAKKVLHPEKSLNDKRNYMLTTLPNGLRLLMITDSTAVKSACAISVRIGSFADPDSSLGLAHFLEHMLFMGSARFPLHNEYSEFMTHNAGYDNAFTDDLETNYYFEIASSKFIEGVDRLSEFFKSALLVPDCVEKERQAVHEEYVLWTNDDNCRKWGILHELGHGQFSRFTIGNQTTLNHPKIHDDLKCFYDTYYSANMINAVLLSNLPFEELESHTKELLQGIPNKQVQPPKFQQPFLPEQLGKLVRMQSIKEEETMEFFWLMEELRPLFRNHFDEYIVHVLGHEGENSLLDLLKEHGFASSATSYQHHIVHGTIIGLELQLTEEGYEHYEEVYNIVTKYIANLRPNPTIYQEIVERNKLLFEFQDKCDNTTYAHTLAQRMHYYPPENVLNYKAVAAPFDKDRLAGVLAQLNPKNVLVILSSNETVENAKVQKYLGASYRVDPLPKPTKESLADLQISANEFLPVSTILLPDDVNASPIQPKRLQDNVVFLPDRKFRTCKGGIALHVYSNENKIYQELYSNWLEAMLKTCTYAAETLKTDLEYEFGTALSINLYGFSDILQKLVRELPQWIASVTDKKHTDKAEGLYQIEHQKMLQDYNNALLESTDDVAEDYLERLLKGKKNTTIEQDIETLQSLTFEEFMAFAKRYWQGARVEWVFVGNFQEQSVLNLTSSFETKLKTKQLMEREEMGCMKIEKPLTVELRVPSDDISTSGAMVYYQHGPTSFHLRVIFELLKTYIKEPFFSDLRTLKQLAYLVRTQVDIERGVIGLKFTIVSSNTDASSVGKEMRDFIGAFMLKFSEQTEAELKTLKESVLVSLTEPHDSLKDQFEFVDNEVSSRSFLFDRKEKAKVQAELNSLTKDDIVKVINEILGRSLSVYVVAKCHEEIYTKKVEAVSSFADSKASHVYYEDRVRKPLNQFEWLESSVSHIATTNETGNGIKVAAEKAHNRQRLSHRMARLAERRC